MLTADGCRTRRQRLLARLAPVSPLLLGDPLNLRYLAGLYVDPLSIAADFGALLFVRRDGYATLFHDTRLPKASLAAARVEEVVPLPWYDGKSPGRGPRRLVLRETVEKAGGRVHDDLSDPLAPDLWWAVTEMRRAKDADELAVLRQCMKATEAGHAWARANLRPGMTELDVYNGASAAAAAVVGRPVVVYGDFVAAAGPERRVGGPTDRVIRAGETFILDFSVVIQGYRSDFTNTLIVGADPTPDQRRLFDLCVSAMAAGEQRLRPGATCRNVYDAVRGVFAAAGLADHFPHHAGHGLGLTHPEAPFFVEAATETLAAGDVVTLEPGLYVDEVGGVRIEHNYHITADGFERLSHHTIALSAHG